jgi:hypothetical protein
VVTSPISCSCRWIASSLARGDKTRNALAIFSGRFEWWFDLRP